MNKTKQRIAIANGAAAPECKKCGGSVGDGIAMGQTYTGIPDFSGDKHPTTISPGGPGKVIECRKCSDCGHSYLPPIEVTPVEGRHPRYEGMSSGNPGQENHQNKRTDARGLH